MSSETTPISEASSKQERNICCISRFIDVNNFVHFDVIFYLRFALLLEEPYEPSMSGTGHVISWSFTTLKAYLSLQFKILEVHEKWAIEI